MRCTGIIRPSKQITMLAARNARQATRILHVLREFGGNGRGDIKKLQGSERWRLRVGDWRIGLKLEGDIAWVLDVSDRQDAYS